MSILCDDCGHETSRYITKFFGSKVKTTCHVCEHPCHAIAQCKNPYENLTIDHVIDDHTGKPLRVTSARQLREAEKRLHFRSLIGHTAEADFDKPPQGESRSIAEIMFAENKFLYPEVAKSMLKEMERNGELMPVAGRR